MHKRKRIGGAVVAGLFAGIPAVHATPTLTALASFSGSTADQSPDALAIGPSGNLIGTTEGGGANGGGAIFQLASGTYSLTNLASFVPPDENDPYTDSGTSDPRGPIVAAPNGAIYGTAAYSVYVSGYGNQNPVPYQLSAGSHAVTQTTPASTPAGFGSVYSLGYISDSAGNLYGYYQGAYNSQTSGQYPTGLFRLNPTNGSITSVGSVNVTTNNESGEQAIPLGQAANASGFFIGSATTSALDSEWIFEINTTTGVSTNLVAFNSSGAGFSNGLFTNFGLIADAKGDVFGTTGSGGPGGDGIVFELAAGSTTLQTLASFNGSNGNSPYALALDSSGNLYGTTDSGGANGDGTVFEIAAGTDAFSTLANFNGSNGADPNDLMYNAGVLYGTTESGTGNAADGTVFEVTGLSVPEPATLSLLSMASVMLLSRRGRRQTIH